MDSLDFLFTPRSVALIGASPYPDKLGGIVLNNLLRFTGKLYPVNPDHAELMGMKACPSIRDIPAPVDLSIIMRPAPEVPAILRELAGKTSCVIVVSAGFAESGAAGLQNEIQQLGRQLGIRILGPNCLGLYNPYNRLDTFFLPRSGLHRPAKGNLAVVSQSGALLVSILEAFLGAKVGISRAINYGNAVDIDAPDIYDYLAADSQTSVVISYLESVGDGRRFVEAAQRLARKKPLVVLKAGKGGGGEAAAFSHTGRLAGRYDVFHSVLGQFGIREAMDFDELTDTAKALALQRVRPGNRICIITNAGGSGVLAADECMRQGLDVPPLSEERKKRLRKSFLPFYAVGNPIDLTGQVKDDDYLTALTAVRDDYDGFVVIALTGVAGITMGLAEMLTAFKERTDKPLVLHVAQGGVAAKLVPHLEKRGIPVYPSPERAVRGMRALLQGARGGIRNDR